LGGTQTGSETHSVSSPFSLIVQRPSDIKPLGRANPTTGIVSQIPMNQYRVKLVKGATVVASPAQEAQMTIDTAFRIPAGIDLSDTEELKSAVSAYFGFMFANASTLVDMFLSGAIK